MDHASIAVLALFQEVIVTPTIRHTRALIATRFVLAAIFLFSGASKIAGSQFSIESFARWGYPDWFRVLVGALEVTGAFGLAGRATSPAAAAGLALLMAGAAVTHLRAPGEAALALLPAALAIVLAIVSRTSRGRAG